MFDFLGKAIIKKQITNSVISPILTNEVKTNSAAAADLKVTTGAAKTLVLDTPIYDDIIISASSLRGGTTAPAFIEFISPIWALAFVDTQTDTVYGSFELPHSYKEGTALEVHLHWSPSNNDTGECGWKFEYAIAGMGTEAFTKKTALILSQPASGIPFDHMYASLGEIAAAGRKIGDVIAFELSRPTGDGFTGSAFLHSIGVHYQVDTLGSRQMSVK